MNIKNNLILALDVGSEKEAIDICEKVKDNIDTIKIGYPLALAEGLEIIQKLKDKFGFNVICDFKVADIDEKNEKICEETFKAGADAIICHGFVGPDSVGACKDVAEKYALPERRVKYILKCLREELRKRLMKEGIGV